MECDLDVGGAVVAVETRLGEHGIFPDFVDAAARIGFVKLHEFGEAVVRVPEATGQPRKGRDGQKTGGRYPPA